MQFLKKLTIMGIMVIVCLLGFYMGYRFSTRTVRNVETVRMETCLRLYQEYRVDTNQKRLAEQLDQIGFTPRDFQTVIDRFIYYRTRKSSISQAMRLLKAFRMGFDIQPSEVVEVSGFASESFRLDAEILAVFEARPELIKQAFEG